MHLQNTSAHREDFMKIKSAVQSVALSLALLVALNLSASAMQRNSDDKAAAPGSDENSAAKTANLGVSKTPSVEDRLRALEQLIDQQQREIQTLHAIIEKRNADNTAVQAGERPTGAPQPAGLTASPPAAVAANQTPASGKHETAVQTQKHI